MTDKVRDDFWLLEDGGKPELSKPHISNDTDDLFSRGDGNSVKETLMRGLFALSLTKDFSFRWYIVDDRGEAIAMSPREFCSRREALRDADRARRSMTL